MAIRRIDLASIRPNPHAGRTQYLVAGKSHEEVSEDGKTVSHVRDIHRLYSLTPEPSTLFSYEPMEVVCIHCHTKVNVDDLGSDVMYGDDGDSTISNICPVCNGADCTEEGIRYETLKEALVRLEYSTWAKVCEKDTMRSAESCVKQARTKTPGTYRIRSHKDAHSGYEHFIVERRIDKEE